VTNDTLMRVRTLVSAEADCLQRIRLAFLAQKRKNAAAHRASDHGRSRTFLAAMDCLTEQ
jgi:hypothetical protein